MADTAPDFTTGVGGDVYSGMIVKKFSQTIDIAANNLTTGTSHKLFTIPAKMLHLTTVVEVITAVGATATADIGTTSVPATDVDSFIDGVDLNAAAGTLWQSGKASTAEVNSILGSAGGYITTVDTPMSLLANNTMTAGKFKVTTLWAAI